MPRTSGAAVPQPSQEKTEDPVTVLVTGFGPFLEKYPVNSSWSIASTLPAILPATPLHPTPIRIIVHHEPIRVAYHSVTNIIPAIIDSCVPKPDIVFHIGLAAGRTFYTLERGAHRTGYNSIPDVDGKLFSEAEVAARWPHLPPILKTAFKTDDVWRRWRAQLPDSNVDIRPSEDAGNFMCGFIYYNTLAHFYQQKDEERPVTFLHVPNLPTKKDVDQGRDVACALIRAMVDSRREHGVTDGIAEKLVNRAAEIMVEKDEGPKTDVNFVA
ncbi:peptidase C15, pyroglutamyl peptidase I-like protein [Mytilinidion resinicola]|uniref:Peptidase C15, pyroglutamyl peptidase I-like protein n=1 Tax=Mytilinidion resinicola TaxID=574789 RepID=A0A6A6Z219_9PEZI|nr:peptidase C15, pyroglutamyl peptidase I-like protein [Mytilinidion resinicola]KAF2815186.1 peptidase C15, pyroglutamyl peptidase I-like protein [Mytilinidion resinicola]